MSLLDDKAKDVIVVILGGGRGQRLDPLTRYRAKPAVPIAGKYRLIDIPISNAIHSGMERMLLLTQFNSMSLHRHIARTYRFDAFSRGFVNIVAAQQTPASDGWFQGTADAVRQNLRVVDQMYGDHVLILAGDHMYRMDYRQMLREHLERQADVTLSLLPCSVDEIADFGAVRVDDAGRIVEFREKPKTAEARAGMEASHSLLESRGLGLERPYLASMGIYIFRKDVLDQVLDNELIDFGHHVIPAALSRFKVQSHFFDGYWRDIGTIGAFYEANLALCGPNPPFEILSGGAPIYSHARFLPPSRIDGATIRHSLVAEGSVIEEGAVIENSIIGLRSVIRRGAVIRNSIIMGNDYYETPERLKMAQAKGHPPMGIGPGAVVEKAIIDKNCRLGQSARVTDHERAESSEESDFGMIRDGIFVLAKHNVLPDGWSL